MKIYIASSWRNEFYKDAVAQFEACGHEVWNWRNPPTGGSGFSWSLCNEPGYKQGEPVVVDVWKRMLESQVAMNGFASDLCGMNWCDIGIMLHPCGKSAHLEAGWLAGRGKRVHVIPVPVEPDLMVLALNGQIFHSVEQALSSYL